MALKSGAKMDQGCGKVDEYGKTCAEKWAGTFDVGRNGKKVDN
jgi:hypothetical protein